MASTDPNKSFLAQLRLAELRLVFDAMHRHGCDPGCSILEIGGGTGWQARELQRAGYRVRSVDVQQKSAVFPVEVYDGHHLPSEDASCDVVFSSNVLEHVAHINAFQDEMIRVLKPGGIAVHLLPTPTWRAATTLAHYPSLVRSGVSALNGRVGSAVTAVAPARISGRRGMLSIPRRIMWSPRHGETGTALSELWLFSSRNWNAHFRRHGWRVLEHSSNVMFYTGYTLLGRKLGFHARRHLARAFGGSCRIYVLGR